MDKSPTMADGEMAYGASGGSALPWILDHYLTYPTSYEIPLRTMYALNSAPRSLLAPPNSQTPRQNSKFAHGRVSAPSSPIGTAFSHTDQRCFSDPAAQFKAQLIAQIARLPTQPCSLPPSFITHFLRRCFSPQLEEVDFPQALTALDYLKDLETRRRKEVAAALVRLGVDRDDLSQKDELGRKYPGVLRWIESIEDKERRVEALYTQVYVGLRRWTLLNEMMLEPYNKANCLAMLNTLFPPVTSATVQPTPQLTPKILQCQRDGFWRYINAIESNGKQILDKVMNQGAREGDQTAWPMVRDALDKYLRNATDIIDECFEVNERDSLETGSSHGARHSRKADSGISFGSSDRSPGGPAGEFRDRQLCSPPNVKDRKFSNSTLERVVREIRKMRIRSGDGEKEKHLNASKRDQLKKAKSSSMLGRNLGSSSSESSFDVDEFKRNRLIWEATHRKW